MLSVLMFTAASADKHSLQSLDPERLQVHKTKYKECSQITLIKTFIRKHILKYVK